MQFAGAAWRISAQALQACLNKSPRLHRELLLGVGSFVVRISLTSWAHGRGTIEQRLAGWLLTAGDCLDTDRITITHQALSEALGVRRPSVTLALQALDGKRAVRSQRGYVRILDGQRLAAAAGGYFLSSATLGS